MNNIRLTVIPAPEGFQLLDVMIGGNGVADRTDLATLRLPSELHFEQGIVLNGRAPVWLYSHLVYRCSSAPWVATFDPRLGAVVVCANSARTAFSVGDLIVLESLHAFIPRGGSPATRKVVAFIGPPHSGKSVLVRALFRRLEADGPIEAFQRDAFVLVACPDGEGKWSSEIPPEQARMLRLKKVWDDEFVTHSCLALAAVAMTKRLVLADLGGVIDAWNERILRLCSHAVIVTADVLAIDAWRGAARAAGVQLLAEIESSLTDESAILSTDPLRLRVGKLERGAPAPTLPEHFVRLFK